MTEMLVRVKGKLSRVSEDIHSANRKSIESIRNKVGDSSEQITHILNPSPLAHVMNDTGEAVGNIVSRNSVVEATVSKAVQWNVRQAKHGLNVAKRIAYKVDELELAVSTWKDILLTRLMEVKAGNFVPGSIKNIFG